MDPDAKTRLSESKPDPMVGRTVDGYRIDEVLGRGGMGTVYRATQLSLGRSVALKVLTDELVEDKQFLERFHREADALSRLSHPNIVTVFERGELEGRPYLVMEFVEGPSLRQVMREGALPPAEALKIVSSVLSALTHAHDRGIVHRDIKPENVLMARGEVVKVADFGLSRLVDGSDLTRLTRTHLVLGTYEYMAPEQREHSKEADQRSDLYATGVVLYELLTGELPIGRFALPSTSRPNECDARIDRIIEKSLEKDPAQRYQEAGEMASAVSRVLERPSAYEAPQPPPPPAGARGKRDSSHVYRPARFEHHVDNLATIDQVLGTVCYVLGAISLFGIMRPFYAYTGGMHFLVLFVMGWYMRETGENLRKYRLSARTSQAVVAILAAFTGVLIPFTIYSFWVLFGHRGRTYFEARNRGLSENESARHTFRVVESSFTPPPPPPQAPVENTPPPPLRPSQIPVQSMVTSDVESRLEAAIPKRKKGGRVSRWLRLGAVFAVLSGVVGLYLAADNPAYARSNDAIVVLFWVTLGLLSVGLLSGLRRRSLRDIWVGGVLLLMTLTGAGFFYEYVERTTRHARRTNDEQYHLGRIRSFAAADPAMAELDARQRAWIRQVTGIKTELPIRIRQVGNYITAYLPRKFVRANRAQANLLVFATQEAIVRTYPAAIRRQQLHQVRVADDYRRAKLQVDLMPGEKERARVWITTLKRGPADGAEMPATESWKLGREHHEWLNKVTGSPDASLLELEVEHGLIHASLPRYVFSRDPARAWSLILAAQELIRWRAAERAPEARMLPRGELGANGTVPALSQQIRLHPPPELTANR
ncbi:MAG: serine/threonine-protein kinase [Planctomycetota bacterium]|jgi:hypothetical protein